MNLLNAEILLAIAAVIASLAKLVTACRASQPETDKEAEPRQC